MTRDEAMIKALAAFDQAIAHRARANMTAMLADDVDPDQIDDFRTMEREAVVQARVDFAARISGLLDGEL